MPIRRIHPLAHSIMRTCLVPRHLPDWAIPARYRYRVRERLHYLDLALFYARHRWVRAVSRWLSMREYH